MFNAVPNAVPAGGGQPSAYRESIAGRWIYRFCAARPSMLTRIGRGCLGSWRLFPLQFPGRVTPYLRLKFVKWQVSRPMKAGRDPTRLGAWIPRLLAGWHVGMTEVEKARQAHEEAKPKRTKQKPTRAVAEAPKELPAGDVTVIGAREQTEDKVVASQSEERVKTAELQGEQPVPVRHPSGAGHRSRARHREQTSAPS
jgi:hypothetical protein